MKKDLNIGKIESKFQELLNLDESRLPNPQKEVKGTLLSSILSSVPSRAESVPSDPNSNPNPKKSDNDELIFTKSDICKEVAKLKPYLRHFG